MCQRSPWTLPALVPAAGERHGPHIGREWIEKMSELPGHCVDLEGNAIWLEEDRFLQRHLSTASVQYTAPVLGALARIGEPLPADVLNGNRSSSGVGHHDIEHEVMKLGGVVLVEDVAPAVVYSNSESASEDLASDGEPRCRSAGNSTPPRDWVSHGDLSLLGRTLGRS